MDKLWYILWKGIQTKTTEKELLINGTPGSIFKNNTLSERSPNTKKYILYAFIYVKVCEIYMKLGNWQNEPMVEVWPVITSQGVWELSGNGHKGISGVMEMFCLLTCTWQN